MFEISKESLLELNKAMYNTIHKINFDNPVEVSAYASSLISVGNQINISLIKQVAEDNKKNKQ